MENKDLLAIGTILVDQAETIFMDCEADDDFCYQGGTVFGGTNRIWFNTRGWYASKTHCTPRFLKLFAKYDFGRIA